jgi:hypothetical protein
MLPVSAIGLRMVAALELVCASAGEQRSRMLAGAP